ncbi:hypothetical protein BC827DRAFT_1263022 [Russula dissimulans]|nr:hypothetical protein BC827DRAFT_1263022 [Russula dissimulans]
MQPHSTSKHTADPLIDHFTAIFSAASTEYQTVTGKRLDAHPFAIQFEDCDDPEAVSDILRTQALAFSNVPQGEEKLMTWLDPTVHILFSFSATLGEWVALPFSPAKIICTGISVLLQAVGDVATSCDKLIHLFERIQLFLERLKIYSGIPLTYELGKLLGKILAELLSVLALSTKEMTDWRISKLIQLLCTYRADYCTELFFMRLLGRNDVEDALSRLDLLTKYSLRMLARNLALPDGFTRLLLSDEPIIDRTKIVVPVAGERARTQRVETPSKSFPDSTSPSLSRRCSLLSTVTATSTLTATSTITATSIASSITAVSTVTDASWKKWTNDDKIWLK